MSDGTIKVPTWALPIGAAALSGAMVWGASQAQATGKLAAVNATKIEAIVDSLAEQSETAKASDAKLQQLIEIMLKNQN